MRTLLLLLAFIASVYAGLLDRVKNVGQVDPEKLLTTPATYVFNLTDDNYDEHVVEGTEWFIQYSASWAKLCEVMDPIFNDVAETMKDEMPMLKFGRVNVDENNVLASRFFIARLPTMFNVKDRYTIRQLKGLAKTPEPIENLIVKGDYMLLPTWEKETSWLHPYTTIGDLAAKWGKFSKFIGGYTKNIPQWVMLLATGTLSGWVLQWLHGVGNKKPDQDVASEAAAPDTAESTAVETVASDAKKEESKKRRQAKRGD